MFRTQTDSYSCGPIALWNAYVWKYSEKPSWTVNKMKTECNTTEDKGTERWDLVISSLGINDKPTYNRNKILSASAFILLYSFGEELEHYIFVSKNNDVYTVHNTFDDSGYIDRTYTEEEFKELYVFSNPRSRSLDFPCAWILE